ncbi:hypothetical protein Dsin_007242 [Dipteronia sinensis]|uniref:Gamma-interferon-inducible lysosomal thiol reductase n=1 Tax=Dipteronia sinensis TaxID=43782 RepID=A0AAE0EI84_9ROSI|nr:hypothetical protein Dsin_007242 [Dipteronia sinensis]
MASCESVYRISITWLFFFFLFLFISSSVAAASYSNFDGNKVSSSPDPQNVNFSIYYETLSPNCSKFIIKNLESVFNNGLISIINLRLVPWGNANISKSTNDSIVCEHGPDECLLNTVQACAINVYNDVNMYLGLISCIEFLAVEGRQMDWKTCFSSLGLPLKPVMDCYNSINGTMLELQYEYETAHLVPPHTLLPWVVVNNQPIRDNYENFTTYVCNAYKGKKVPPSVCKSSLPFAYLCPGCATFISEYLVKVFEKGLIDIVNLRLVPWGNAKLVQPNNTIICQHGEDECYLNTIHACAINAWTDVKTHFDFIRCQDSQTPGESIGDKEKLWRSCCQNLKLSELPIQECYSSGLGKNLVLQYGNETRNLIPPHEYVPWVTVNEKPIGDDMLNYKKHVCDAYKGSHVPEACKELRPPTKTTNTDDDHRKAMSSNSVCYNDEAMNLFDRSRPPKVDLVLYYETLCPACADFITTDLVKIFQTDLYTIVNFRLVPWGNAKVINCTIVCQHGEDECYLNIIDACIIKAWPEVKKHFPFISCIEAENSAMQVKHSKDVEKSWRKCAHYLGFPQEPIDKCYDSGEGIKLSLRYGNETPSHEYVPWITVNKVPLKENYTDYIRYVCNAYKGCPVEACKSKLSSSTLKVTSTNPVCYTEKSRNYSLFVAADDSGTEGTKRPRPPG